MQYTSCTEDRIHHALATCLDGLSLGSAPTSPWQVGMCMNRWSLEELLKRDPENFLILLQEILRRMREVQAECQYELVAPLTLMFSSTLLQTPYFPLDCAILTEACEVFRCFLTWPEPYCSLCKELLSTLHQELRAPGISYHRLVRGEQGLTTANHRSKIITVLLMNPIDVPPEFLTVSEQLSSVRHPQRETHITLIKHAFQSTLGTKYPLHRIDKALQSKSAEEVGHIFSAVTEVLEAAASMEDPRRARAHLLQGLEGLRQRIGVLPSSGKKSDGMLQTLLVPTAKCYSYQWDKDNFDILHDILEQEHGLGTGLIPPGQQEEDDDEDDEEEEEEEEKEEDEEEEVDVRNGYAGHRISTLSTVSTFSTTSKDSMFSTFSIASNCSVPSVLSVASGVDSDFCEDMEDSPPERTPKSKARLSNRISMLWARSTNTLIRAKSLGSPEAKDRLVVRSKRSNSLPQQVQQGALEQRPLTQVCFRRRPILSCDEDCKAATLRVVVFGADHAAGKVARAYSNLRLQENACPRLTRLFRLQFFFIPVKRGSGGPAAPLTVPSLPAPSTSPLKGTANTELNAQLSEDSTNDIAHFIGILDPWYERNVLSLLNLPVGVLCQQTSKIEIESCDNSSDRLPILADLVLYYCRYATRPVLVQLYQAELTLAGGERRTEVFVHSLELGHTAGTRAIKAMGAASKRFGIDGDREAVPLTLEVMYNKVGVSGRSQWNKAEKVCTSITLTKACKKPEELDSKMEYLKLMLTEVLKRQNSKSRKGYNQQLSTMEVKVDKVQVNGAGSTTFAVCLDQDEKKIFQSVTRCEVSVCYKPDSIADWRLRRALAAQSQPLHPTFCSLLCLPIASFSGAQP